MIYIFLLKLFLLGETCPQDDDIHRVGMFQPAIGRYNLNFSLQLSPNIEHIAII